jgi:hypothetical protein
MTGATGLANAAVLKIVGPITGNVALSAANEYILEGGVFIKSGGTLTIPAGTVVRGQPRTGPVIAGQTIGTPGFLTVTRTGSINVAGAPGTPGNPGTVIFTTAALDANADRVADACVSGPPICDFAFYEPVAGGCVDANADGVCENDLGPQPFLDSTPKTAPLAPINGAGLANVQLWGGFVVLGRAPTNLDAQRGAGCVGAEGGTGIGQGTVEGLAVPGYLPEDACYGGYLPHDSSGSIRYLSVRHAGDALDVAAANELNGVTLAGVGDATVYEFVEVYMNFDDGHEIFGGTVRGNNLVADLVGDDSFDTDQGYTGTLQFLFGLQPWFNQGGGSPTWGQSSGDRATELDGDDCAEPGQVCYLVGQNDLQGASNAPVPIQMNHQILYNVTVIGSTPDSGEPGTATRDGAAAPVASANVGLTARNGWQGEIHNAIVVNTGSQPGLRIDGGGGNPAGTQTVADCIATDSDGNGTGDVCVTVCSTLNDGAAPAADATNMMNNGNARFSTALDNNVINSAGFPNLIEEDHTFLRTGNPATGKLDATLVTLNPVLNPRPAAGLTGTGNCQAPTIKGISSTAYRGAFNPQASVPLWTSNWTVRSIAGLIAN